MGSFNYPRIFLEKNKKKKDVDKKIKIIYFEIKTKMKVCET